MHQSVCVNKSKHVLQVATLKTQLQNGSTHAAELKKRLAGSGRLF